MSSREPLIIVGAGGLASEVAEAVRAGESFEALGYLDDDPALHGLVRTGLPVLGGIDQAGSGDTRLVICPGSGATRLRLEERLGLLGVGHERYAIVRHPSVALGSTCQIGAGSVLLAGVVLTADVSVGRHVVAMPHVVLTHDDEIADGVTLCAGVTLAGRVRVGRGAYLGAGAMVREDLVIGSGAVVGLGAVVLQDVPPGEVWVGNPAHRLRTVAKRSAAPAGSDTRS